MKRIALLGSTGSIGTQTLDVVAQHPDRLQVVSLAAWSSSNLLEEQAQRFGVGKTALVSRDGDQALIDFATADDVDVVVMSIVGSAGLRATVAALQAGKRVALASKEVLVSAGEVVMPLAGGSILESGEEFGARPPGGEITPIDSEHSALFQCLQGFRTDQIESLILTASGGPFRGRGLKDLEGVTREQALNHPTWNMGGKITIDSATLMNKALEMIEARWLFGVEMDQVQVVVHPQSVVHSLAKLKDGSALGQLGWPDMRLPIQVALLHPDRVPGGFRPWNPVDTPSLTFEALDESVFRGPRLAREAMAAGGDTACALNAANEVAVDAFLKGEISFLGIYGVIEDVLERHHPSPATLESLLGTDLETRRFARSVVETNRR